jgi:predicted metal-dependent enzyme (double-stranded beta helix superfamily)
MAQYTLDDFLADSQNAIANGGEPYQLVDQIAPKLQKLLQNDTTFLKPEHFLSDPEHYARNAIYVAEDDRLSFYALVWEPGQWTPIHDHGTWGVVGVLEGVLHETNYICTNKTDDMSDDHVELVRGGIIMLAPGAVTSFVPNPDHIHMTGNANTQNRVVSLHMYGHSMAGFYSYDINSKSRTWTETQHNES